MMENIPDDPIISCMLRTGYPPWMQDEPEEDEEPDDESEDEE